MGDGRAVVEPFVEPFVKPFKEPFVEPLQSRCRAVHRDDAAVRRDDAEPFVRTIVGRLYKQW